MKKLVSNLLKALLFINLFTSCTDLEENLIAEVTEEIDSALKYIGDRRFDSAQRPGFDSAQRLEMFLSEVETSARNL